MSAGIRWGTLMIFKNAQRWLRLYRHRIRSHVWFMYEHSQRYEKCCCAQRGLDEKKLFPSHVHAFNEGCHPSMIYMWKSLQERYWIKIIVISARTFMQKSFVAPVNSLRRFRSKYLRGETKNNEADYEEWPTRLEGWRGKVWKMCLCCAVINHLLNSPKSTLSTLTTKLSPTAHLSRLSTAAFNFQGKILWKINFWLNYEFSWFAGIFIARCFASWFTSLF